MQIIDRIVYRWRLWKICKRLDIKPYPWQRDYVLGRSNSLPIFSRSGKTMAVILYGLVRKIRYQDDIYKLAWQRIQIANAAALLRLVAGKIGFTGST